MKFLVTGGAGFIGSNLATATGGQRRQGQGARQFFLGKDENLADLEGKIDLIEGDIRDYWTVVKAVEGIDYILHQAALPSVPRSVANPLTTNEVNINGTLNVLQAARMPKSKRSSWRRRHRSTVNGGAAQARRHDGQRHCRLTR